MSSPHDYMLWLQYSGSSTGSDRSSCLGCPYVRYHMYPWPLSSPIMPCFDICIAFPLSTARITCTFCDIVALACRCCLPNSGDLVASGNRNIFAHAACILISHSISHQHSPSLVFQHSFFTLLDRFPLFYGHFHSFVTFALLFA